MGNCLFGGMGEVNEVVKVVTSDGGIMEFNGPITVECITDEFPGHGIFRISHDHLFWKPLPHHEVLVAGGGGGGGGGGGESYYLLPINNSSSSKGGGVGGQIAQVGYVRSNSSVPATATAAASNVAPYRMSFDGRGMLKRSSTEVFSRYNNNNNNINNGGLLVWKVKLVISPCQLLEILSQEARTQELIESVRTVAKCGNIGFSSVRFSDQYWSLSSIRNASSQKECLSEI